MVKHAILLASEEWCKVASAGGVRIYDFLSKRKKNIRALNTGSVCVVLTKAARGKRSVFYGEFTAKEVKRVGANEYNKLASEGLIHNPQTLGPNDMVWIVAFDEFREYNKKIPKREVTDIKTFTSKEPISEWAIYGLSYIDEQALEGIRRKAGGFVKEPDERIKRLEERITAVERLLGISELALPVSHECAELMLLRIGNQLGFRVYTADRLEVCGDARLGDLASLSREELGKYVGTNVLDSLSRVDVVWYKDGRGYYAFEVVVGGNMHEALIRLAGISGLEAKLFIVADANKKREYERDISNPAFSLIRNRCRFLTLDELVRIYVLTNLWSKYVEELQLTM